MLSTAVIIFREVLEIALILGVVLAATRGLPKRSQWVWGGLIGGLSAAGVVAYFAETISKAAEGMGQEVFNALVLFLAALLIAWTVVWMQRHGRLLTQRLKETGRAVTAGEQPVYTLAVVVALAVLREGSEIVLFLYGILASGESLAQVLIGCAIGFAMGSAVGVTIYYGLVKVSTGKLFSITSWLLMFLAAGMVSGAVELLSSAGWISLWTSPLWDTSGFLSESSLLGRVFHALLGYTERPSGIQWVSYLATLGGIAVMIRKSKVLQWDNPRRV